MIIFATPQIPDINFAATTLYGLAGLERTDTEPPETQHLTDQQLQTLPPPPLELDLPLSSRGGACRHSNNGIRSILC